MTITVENLQQRSLGSMVYIDSLGKCRFGRNTATIPPTLGIMTGETTYLTHINHVLSTYLSFLLRKTYLKLSSEKLASVMLIV